MQISHRSRSLRSGHFILLGATCYGLDVPGAELREGGGEIFHTRSDQSWGPQSVCCTMGTGSFLGIKRQVHGVDHLTPSSAAVKEKVEL